jgi:transposase
MTKMPHDDRLVIVGVDTHADLHVAVVLDAAGQVLGSRHFSASAAGYCALIEWASEFGIIDRLGIEGTGCWGRGLTLFCLSRGLRVLDVDRPDRRIRRRLGKTDLIDAEAAARAVLAGTATTLPKTGDGPVEMLRVLHITRETAVRARTQAMNQLQALATTAPLELAEQLRRLPTKQLLAIATCFPVDLSIADPVAATKLAMRSLARRIEDLSKEIDRLTRARDSIVEQTAPELLERKGIGHHSAATLLIAAGDNPDRLGSEASFARLCAAAPIPVASGRSDRHRLHRGGHRQANRALHTIVVSRLRWPDERTRQYVQRRNRNGHFKADLDTIRRLKRYVAREVYPIVLRALTRKNEPREAPLHP